MLLKSGKVKFRRARGESEKFLGQNLIKQHKNILGVSQALSVALASFFLGVGEGNGTPLQYSCLENPMDGGAC